MRRIANTAEGFNRIPPANQHNATASATSAFTPEGVAERSGDKKQKHQKDECDDKIHYLSTSFARKHGLTASAVLTGFALKLKGHKHNWWKDRYWYYECIDTLRKKRWPYLSDGCLCETINYLSDQRLLVRDSNNKRSGDRTSWYAMNAAVRDSVLKDVVWYDVGVTRKLRSIAAGLIYHNLRYHLGEVLKNESDCLIPYHKVNKTQLARDLPISESTVKRAIKELVMAGIIIPHGTKKKYYTIAAFSEIGSNMNANRSFVNGSDVSAIGSKVNGNGSNLNGNGSNLNAIRSKVNDYTLYETNKKPFTNQLEKSECVNVFGDRNNYSQHESVSRHKLDSASELIIKDTVTSGPVPGKEKTGPSPSGGISSFEQILAHNKKLSPRLANEFKNIAHSYRDDFENIIEYFCTNIISIAEIQGLWGIADADELLERLHEKVSWYLKTELEAIKQAFSISEDDAWSLYYLPMMESLVGGFLYAENPRNHTIQLVASSAFSTYDTLMQRRENEMSMAPADKTQVFKESVEWNNKYGWQLDDGSSKMNLVPITKAGMKSIAEVFENNPDISPIQLRAVLGQCVEVSLTDKPDGFDKHWHARQGTNLAKLVKWLDVIVQELDMFQECPISMAA